MYKETIKDNPPLLTLYGVIETLLKVLEAKFSKEEAKELLLEQIKEMLKEM